MSKRRPNQEPGKNRETGKNQEPGNGDALSEEGASYDDAFTEIERAEVTALVKAAEEEPGAVLSAEASRRELAAYLKALKRSAE